MDTATGGASHLAGGDTLLSDNLFLFGDRDGPAPSVLLQHPLGIATAELQNEGAGRQPEDAKMDADDVVYIADSYNHKIKVRQDIRCRCWQPCLGFVPVASACTLVSMVLSAVRIQSGTASSAGCCSVSARLAVVVYPWV